MELERIVSGMEMGLEQMGSRTVKFEIIMYSLFDKILRCMHAVKFCEVQERY